MNKILVYFALFFMFQSAATAQTSINNPDNLNTLKKIQSVEGINDNSIINEKGNQNLNNFDVNLLRQKLKLNSGDGTSTDDNAISLQSDLTLFLKNPP